MTVAQSSDFQFLFSHSGRPDIYWSSTGNIFIKLATILCAWQYSPNHCHKQLICHFTHLCSLGHTCSSWMGIAAFHIHFSTVRLSIWLHAFQDTEDHKKMANLTFRNASFCSRCLLIMGVTWSVSELGPSLSAPPHQSSSRLYSCSRLSSTLHTYQEKGIQLECNSVRQIFKIQAKKPRKPVYPLHIPYHIPQKTCFDWDLREGNKLWL